MLSESAANVYIPRISCKVFARPSSINFSRYLTQVAEGAGPVSGLHSSEQKLNAIEGLNVLHLRAAYFMENNLAAIGMIHGMGLVGNALLPALTIPMAATRDVGEYAGQRLLHLDFSGKQTRELLGERDLSMTEATAVIARHRQTGSQLRAVPVRPGAAGVDAIGCSGEGSSH